MTGSLCVLILLLQLYSVSEALKVISTNMKDLLPDMTGQVVVLNSSLAGLDQWTVCLRVETFHSSFHHQGDPYQTLIGRQMFSDFDHFSDRPTSEKFLPILLRTFY